MLQLSPPSSAICLFHFHGNATTKQMAVFVFMKVGQTTADKQEGWGGGRLGCGA